MKNKVRDKDEMESLLSFSGTFSQWYATIDFQEDDDFKAGDVLLNGEKLVEIKRISKGQMRLENNIWFSTSSGYTGAVRYKKNDPSTGYTYDALEGNEYTILNPYDKGDSTGKYVYGFPESVKGKRAIMVNLDGTETPVWKNKYYQCVTQKVGIAFEFKDCWVVYKWDELEDARLCSLEMWIRTGHANTSQFGSHQPCWERKVALDLDKARIIVK